MVEIQRPLNNHIKFEWKFMFLMKNYEIMCCRGGNSSYLVATIRVLTFAPCWIWCKIHLSKLYEITWKDSWNTFYLVATRWVLFPIMLNLVSNSASYWKFMQLHEKMVEICPIWWAPHVFGPPLHIEVSPQLKLKSQIN
jgi:hypothetical protein